LEGPRSLRCSRIAKSKVKIIHDKISNFSKLCCIFVRFYASDDDIRRAYRKIVLKHHPDKRKGQGEQIDPDDDYFTCITRAYEFLGNPQKRRSYDSIDPFFVDDLPSQSEVEKKFFQILGPCFKLNARWSEKKNVPLLGDEKSTRSHVERFYDFWYDFQSWREYSYLDEEDKEKGQDRDERRWIDKQNKVMRAKRKKEEMARIRQLVDLAYNNDPRIVKFKKEEKDKKLAAKKAKQTAAQALKEMEEQTKREEEAQKLKLEKEEQKRLEQLQKEKELQKRALKKERKSLRDFAKSKSYFASDDIEKIRNIENVEKLCEALKLLDLQELNKKMGDDEENAMKIYTVAVDEMEKQLEEERKQSLQPTYLNSIGKNTSNPITPVNKKSLWNNENVQLLIKAVNIFPAGTNQRWEVVANFINQHATNMPENVKFNAKEVLNKAKDIQSSDFSKNELKAQINQNAFESFEKNKKELKVVDNSDISQKDPGEAAKAKKKKQDSPPPQQQQQQEQAVPQEPQVNGNAKAESKEAKVWTKEEQALLEQAIKTYPVSTPDRWDRIAECIPNRNKKECLRRVKELVDLVNAKNKAQQIK
jgi:DnaJ homolog subfamily C member 2